MAARPFAAHAARLPRRRGAVPDTHSETLGAGCPVRFANVRGFPGWFGAGQPLPLPLLDQIAAGLRPPDWLSRVRCGPSAAAAFRPLQPGGTDSARRRSAPAPESRTGGTESGAADPLICVGRPERGIGRAALEGSAGHRGRWADHGLWQGRENPLHSVAGFGLEAAAETAWGGPVRRSGLSVAEERTRAHRIGDLADCEKGSRARRSGTACVAALAAACPCPGPGRAPSFGAGHPGPRQHYHYRPIFACAPDSP